ncbi:IS1634 family transposase [Methanospirillum sp. J.3.6.1-F.2.7.3]|uniref:IS1634 family transposase n=1 Tax=Methanospirillum purgamenti TaxID=2834276 RepID=A0A8E7B2F4_9EURY|nr:MULTISPECIES: IS1634 family transposase [Methanospirillum]MDX8549465.1 IS1634 family transposase [Methanospirillum hungatei]QVV89253.1 IS1634 family transposase [Methanospirillum sp. J.3.6.1-F.2.7.3]
MEIIEDSNVTIAHLGIVSGIMDSLGIPQYIDSVLPKKSQHKVSWGTATKALILNGLGFNERRLFLMPEYFDDLATEHLLGEGIRSEDLNQYMFGDCLEAIAAYGPTRLFTGITLNIMKQIKFGTHRLHYDTTTINVTGEYDQTFNTRLIEIVRGHSKDHRNDLKQFIISLVTNQHGIPLFMEPLSGNISDKKTLIRTILEVRQNLITDETVYHMADSAFYSADNISSIGDMCFWITRVPELIKEAHVLVTSDVVWVPCSDSRYSYSVFESSYGGIPQRWILFHSREQQKRSIQTQMRNLVKTLEKDRIALKKLCVTGFACEADARKTVERWLRKHPRYILSELIISVKNQRTAGIRGRPKRDEVLDQVYFVSCKIDLNQDVIAREQEQMGRFILASNDTTIDPELMLTYYKEQSTVERGFKFIKDKSFHASEVYLENENRIAALVMITVLCLLVYSIVEWLVRKTLKERKITIRNQVGKSTDNPRAKWVFFLFRRVRQITLVVDNNRVTKLLNINEEIRGIADLLGKEVEKYYS